jgi:putative ATP-binding cassette transporter
MKTLQLILRDLDIDRGKFLLFATISGLANAAVLSLVNIAAENAAREVRSHRYLLLFAIAVTIYVVAQKYIMITATQEAERVIHRIRVRLIHAVRATELVELEKIGGEEIHSSISAGTATLSDAAVYIVVALQSTILVTFVLLYIASLSITAMVLCVVFTVAGAGVHLLRAKEINRKLHAAMRDEHRLQEGLSDMLRGFKETKVSSARGDELSAWIERSSQAAAAVKAETQRLFSNDFVISQVTFFLLTATMVFLVPILGGAYNKVVIKTTAATLFLIGPISNAVTAVPVMTKARAALENILGLERRLRAVQRPVPAVEHQFHWRSEIRFEGVTFRYDDGAEGFLVGPLDLSFKRGETVFITGGNGSGKTTLIRLLTGLYQPFTGRITVDGVPVEDSGIVSYRNLFSVVFSDYHLSRRLYGVPAVADDEVAKLFEILEMGEKTKLSGREFDTIDLSGGQRKRLALMISVLENKPISVFDEWAADQDPYFRKKFYTEILDWLKSRGSTLIVVTHDDRYFHLADRMIVMREGRIAEGEAKP